MPVLPELPPLPPAPVPTSTAPTKAQIDAAVSSKTAGNTLYSAGKYADSVEAYTQSLGAVEQQPVVLSNRAMALIKLERFSQVRVLESDGVSHWAGNHCI